MSLKQLIQINSAAFVALSVIFYRLAEAIGKGVEGLHRRDHRLDPDRQLVIVTASLGGANRQQLVKELLKVVSRPSFDLTSEVEYRGFDGKLDALSPQR